MLNRFRHDPEIVRGRRPPVDGSGFRESAHYMKIGAGQVFADHSVPSKVVAAIMGHTKVDTTLNIYTQVLDGAKREAADRVGSQLARIGQTPGGATALIH
jgi:integrase